MESYIRGVGRHLNHPLPHLTNLSWWKIDEYFNRLIDFHFGHYIMSLIVLKNAKIPMSIILKN